MKITENNMAGISHLSVKEWLEGKNRKLFITDRVANANRMLRQYERVYGLGVKEIYSKTLVDIAREIVTAYYAVEKREIHPVRLVDQNVSQSIIYRILTKKSWSFIPEESIDMACAGEVFISINKVRGNDTTREYTETVSVKIREIKEIISEYEKDMKDSGFYDEIMVEKEALDILRDHEKKDPDSDKSGAMFDLIPWFRDCEIGILDNTEFNKLQLKLVEQLKKLACVYDKELYVLSFKNTGRDSDDGENVRVELFKAYGFENEVRYIMNTMSKNNISTADVNIFYTDPVYEKLLRAGLETHGMGYIFMNGISALYSDHICALIKILDLADDDMSYEKLEKVVESRIVYKKGVKLYREFKRTSKEGIGWGIGRYRDHIQRKREEFAAQDADDQESPKGFVEFLEDICDIFYDGITVRDSVAAYMRLIEFAKKYFAGKKKFNMEILPVLYDGIVFVKQFSRNMASDRQKIADVTGIIRSYIENLTYKESGSMAEREGQEAGADSDSSAVHIYRMSRYIMPDRRHNFFVGLTSHQFGVKESDSPVLGDAELKKYIDGEPELAADHVKRTKEAFADTVGSLVDGTVYLGRSEYDTVNFVELAAASVLLDYEKGPIEVGGSEKLYSYGLIDEWERYEAPAQKDLGEEDNDETDPYEKTEDNTADQDEDSAPTGVAISATALKDLVNCPLKYYYHYVKYLTYPSYFTKKAFQWLPANKKGDLFHRTLDNYCKAIGWENGSLPEKADQAIFDHIYNETVDKMSQEVPSLSEEQREKEIEDHKGTIWKYVTLLHEQVNADRTAGRDWKLIGSELAFQDLQYQTEDNTNDENDESQRKSDTKNTNKFSVLFNGSIDRLDGYVKKGILYLRIVDYKTGNKKHLKDDIEKNGIQLQHYVYAMAAIDFYTNNRAELEKKFGSEIKACSIEAVDYVFPYDTDTKDGEVAVISVIDEVRKCIKEEQVENGKVIMVSLPDRVNEILQETIGALQNMTDDQSTQNMQRLLLERHEDKGVAYFNNKSFFGRPESDSNECKYCDYIGICRMRCYVSDVL